MMKTMILTLNNPKIQKMGIYLLTGIMAEENERLCKG
jgi:hypothetical protein